MRVYLIIAIDCDDYSAEYPLARVFGSLDSAEAALSEIKAETNDQYQFRIDAKDVE